MKRELVATTLGLMLTAGTALAVEPALDALLGTDAGAISGALGESGYDMTRYDQTGAAIRVEAIKDDRRVDIAIDPATGRVVALEARLRNGPDAPLGAAMEDDAIRAALAAEGYEITKYERERGEVEVYARRDGRTWELKVDPRTGRVLKAEVED